MGRIEVFMIGFYDSGIGGVRVLKQKDLPFVYFADTPSKFIAEKLVEYIQKR